MALLFKEIVLRFEAELKFVFDKLPQDMKNDPEIAIHQTCTEHFEANGDNLDTIDGPPFSKKKCIECLALALKSL